MTEKYQRIKCYYKSEIADLYEIKVRILMNWIKEILPQLQATGYYRRQQILTLKQVEIIFNHLGHPSAINEKNIHTGRKVAVIPYQKSRLAFFYDITSKQLIKQIKSIPDYDIVKKIMDSPTPYYWEIMTDKKYFRKEEVKLIFEYLGHPYYAQV